MTMTEESPQISEEEALVTDTTPLAVGKTLKEKREKLGMSLEEAASQLHLDGRLLQALESDDYSSLPGTAYAYGYLRSYAKLLKVPEADLLEQFQQVMDTESNALIPEHMTFAAKNKVPAFSLRQMFIVVMVFILAVGAIVWVLIGSSLLDPSKEAALQPANETTANDMTVTTMDEPAREPLNLKPQEESVTIEALPESSVSIEEKKQAAQPDSERVTPAVPEAEAAPKKALELSFQKDSWTEVRDATGETLIYRMVNEGEHLALNGQAPYTILLGYAPGVTVTYKGDVFDTKPFQRDDIAYFRIGRKSPDVATEE